jgi:hypothetical protein
MGYKKKYYLSIILLELPPPHPKSVTETPDE